MKLQQLIDAADESIWVSRFLLGVRDNGIRKMISIGQEDISKVTVAQLNTQIVNQTGAGDESGSGREDNHPGDKSGGDSNNDHTAKKTKKSNSVSPQGLALKVAQKLI